MRRPLLALALALAMAVPLLVAPGAAASGISPPQQAQKFDLSGRQVSHWVSNATELVNASAAALQSIAPGSDATLWVGVVVDRQDTNASRLVFFVNVSSAQLAFTNTSAELNRSFEGVVTSEEFHYASFAFRAANTLPNASASYTVSVEGFAVNATGNWTKLGAAVGTGQLTIDSVAASAPVGIPTWAYYAGGAGLLLVVGVIVYSARQRNLRTRMRGDTRSQALREAELEELARKKPEQAAVIKQEIRQQETVREKRRELQILEAKRADIEKNMGLLKKRHEMGALSKLQYDQMVAKKQAELVKLDAEIAAMEAADGGGSSAA